MFFFSKILGVSNDVDTLWNAAASMQFDVWEDASNYPAVEMVRWASQASAAPDIARYQQDANLYRQVSGFPKSRKMNLCSGGGCRIFIETFETWHMCERSTSGQLDKQNCVEFQALKPS